MRVAGWITEHFRVPRAVWWPHPLEDRTLAIDTIELVTFELVLDDGTTGNGYTCTRGHGRDGRADRFPNYGHRYQKPRNS